MNFKGYRTFVFNLIVLVFAGLEAADLTAIVPADYIPAIIAAISAINLWLRRLTTTPLGQKR